MTDKTIYFTEFDAKRIRELLAKLPDPEKGEKLQEELNRAVIVQPAEVPPDVITMNSKVRLLDLDTREDLEYTLVFPEAADLRQGKISVLAPIGTAMIGYRVGDLFAWEVPDGVRKLKVLEVLYQPEASGNYDL